MNDQLNAYITENLTRGISKETIEQNLIAAGWKKDQINPVLYPTSKTPAEEPAQLPVKKNSHVQLSSIFLRTGLAFVFVYAAISISLNPADGMKFLPAFVSHIVPGALFLQAFGVYEIALSVWLLTGKWHKYSGYLAALTIFAITSMNLSDFSVLFRNVAIFFAGLALANLP